MKKKLHPAVKISWRIMYIVGYILLAFFFSLWIFPFTLSFGIFGLSLKIMLIILVIILIIAEIWVRLSYIRWFYEFTSTNLKTERGVIFKRYGNIPYERIQNVDIRRGIIARIFGFSSLMIQTAGYSYGGTKGFGSEGYVPGVDMKEAEQIRDFLMKKISKKHSQGL